MQNVLSLAVVGLLTSISYANAASIEASPQTVPGIRYFCEFEGRGLSEHGHQDRDIRCKVEGVLSGMTGLAGPVAGNVDTDVVAGPVIPGGPVEVKCSNGYKLETEYSAIAYQGSTLWINAEKYDKLATLRIKDFNAVGTQEDGKRFKADLLAANSSVIHGEGKCKFEYPYAPPAPPAPPAPME